MKKQDIVDFINEEFEETFEIVDIFYNAEPRNGRLRFCGYRHLSNFYDFKEVEFKFQSRGFDIIALHKRIKGLYYISNTKDKDHIRLFATDHSLVNRIKIYGSDFTKIADAYKSWKNLKIVLTCEQRTVRMVHTNRQNIL